MAIPTLNYSDPHTAGWVIDNSLAVRDVSATLHSIIVGDADTFLRHAKTGQMATSPKVEWVEMTLNAWTVEGSYDSTAGTFTITSPASQVDIDRRCRKYAILVPSDLSMYIQLTDDPVPSPATVSATVIEGTDADKTGTFYVLANPAADEERIERADSIPRTTRWNSIHAFTTAFVSTQTNEAMLQYPGPKSGEAFDNIEIKNLLVQLKHQTDRAMIFSVPQQSGGNYTANVQYRTMAGFVKQVRDPDLDGTNEDTTVVDASNSLLSLDLIDELVYKVLSQGGMDGQSKPVLIMSAANRQLFSSFENELRRRDADATRRGAYATTYISKFGKEIPVLWDRNMFTDSIVLLVDTNRLERCYFKGATPAVRELPLVNPWSRQKFIGYKVTLKVKNAAEAHGLIMNLASPNA